MRRIVILLDRMGWDFLLAWRFNSLAGLRRLSGIHLEYLLPPPRSRVHSTQRSIHPQCEKFSFSISIVFPSCPILSYPAPSRLPACIREPIHPSIAMHMSMSIAPSITSLLIHDFEPPLLRLFRIRRTYGGCGSGGNILTLSPRCLRGAWRTRSD